MFSSSEKVDLAGCQIYEFAEGPFLLLDFQEDRIRLVSNCLVFFGGSWRFIWFIAVTRLSLRRTLVYAVECPILMRTEMGLKIVSSSILMRTESPNFGRRFDPFWVRKWPVGTEVRSHFRTFVAIDSNLKISPTKNGRRKGGFQG
jgi:hypothetical protein